MKKFILLFFLAITQFSLGYELNKKYNLEFYHVNDTHGVFEKSNKTNAGGFGILSTMVKEARARASQTKTIFFLTSGGDVNTGTPESDVLFAEPDFRSMGAIGFDAMVLGNHEFDHHWSHINKQQKWAGFPFLAANIKNKTKKKFSVLPYVVKEVYGLKIAFLGLITDQTKLLTLPANTKGLEITSAVETAKYWVPILRKQADVVVVLTHLGWCDLGQCQEPNDVQLAMSVPGIDLILGGHSHTLMKQADVVSGTYIFQSYEKNQKVGVLQAEFYNGKFAVNSSEVKDIIGAEDQVIVRMQEPLKSLSQKKLKTVVAYSKIFLDGERESIRYKETELTNLILMIFRKKTNSDIAILNAGGIRASLEPGDITVADIHRVLPFPNTLCTVELSGEKLIKYMNSIVLFNTGEGDFPHFSGVNLKTNSENKIIDIKINGQTINLKKKYKIVVNNYIAEGGDGYPQIKNETTFKDSGLIMKNVFHDYLKKKKIINSKDVSLINYYQRHVAN